MGSRQGQNTQHLLTPSQDLPVGFRVRLHEDLILADEGRLLVGGSPVRVVRLSAKARALLSGGWLTVDGPATAQLARRLLEGNLAIPLIGDFDVAPTDVTVVVPVRDRPDQLERCLAALAPLRVIVVDDASKERHSVAWVAQRHGASVLALSANRGPAGARNAGLRLVRTPLVAFVDSDVTIDSNRLLDLARHCADPQVALVGPRIVGWSRSPHPRWFERYDMAASSLDRGRVEGTVRPGARVGWLPSACLVGRAAHLRGDIGGFEDSWRVAEDVDLIWRLIGVGRVVRYDPSVEAAHDVRSTYTGWLWRKFVYGTGGADLADRHGAMVAPAVLSPVMALGGAALLQRRWWSIPAAVTVTGIAARSIRAQLPTDCASSLLPTRLAARALGSALSQESTLLLRHWWPITALAASCSRSVRRAVLTAVLVDAVGWLRDGPDVEHDSFKALPTALIGRRLDDLAYGTGLWWGALRRRDPRCLAVRMPRTTRNPWRTGSSRGVIAPSPARPDPSPPN